MQGDFHTNKQISDAMLRILMTSIPDFDENNPSTGIHEFILWSGMKRGFERLAEQMGLDLQLRNEELKQADDYFEGFEPGAGLG